MAVAALTAARADLSFWSRNRLPLLAFLASSAFIIRAIFQFEDLDFGLDLAHIVHVSSKPAGDFRLLSDLIDAPLLSHHLYLILIPLKFLYRLFPHPLFFQFLQTGVLIAAALILANAAALALRDTEAGRVIGASVMLHPAFSGQAMSEFDPGCFGFLALAWAFRSLVARKNISFWLAVLLAFLSKEQFQLGAITAGLGLVWGGRRGLGAALLVAGLFWSAGNLLILQPLLSPDGGAAAVQASVRMPGLLTASGPLEAVKIVSRTIFVPAKIGYLLHLLAPLFFLPLLAPLWILPALPEIGIVLLSTFPMYHMGSHYVAATLPCLAAAATAALKARPDWQKRLLSAMTAASISAALLANLGPFSHTTRFWSPLYEDHDYVPTAREALQAIPDEGSIGVVGNQHLLLPLASRIIRTPLPYVPGSREKTLASDIVIFQGEAPPEEFFLTRRVIFRKEPLVVFGEKLSGTDTAPR